MTGYDFIECAKRLGGVLVGRVEPSVEQVRQLASEIATIVSKSPDTALKAVYDKYAQEPLPDDLLQLVKQLEPEPRSYRPRQTAGARRASH